MAITKHAHKRSKERLGIGKANKKIIKQAQMALERGIKHGETKGNLKKWIDMQFFKYQKGNNMRIYAGYLYVFHDDILITVYPVPGNLQKNLMSYVKKREETELVKN